MSVELELNKLRREPENQFCGTCRKQDKIGHKNVCMKFRIFVCAECKSAHQAFSHKCKSVTMSNWSKEEVAELKGPVGGNARNRATVFAKLKDESDAWPKNCPPDVVKEFVTLAYDKLKWYDANATPRAERTTSAPDIISDATPAPMAGATRIAPSYSTPSVFAAAPQVAPSRTAPLPETTSAVDLLGGDLLGGFEALSATPVKPISAAPIKSAVGAHDEWSAFSAAPAAVTPARDEWAAFAGAPKPAPTTAASGPKTAKVADIKTAVADLFGDFESAKCNAAPMAPVPMVAAAMKPAPAAMPVGAKPAPPQPAPQAAAADPFSALSASGFSALGAVAPLAKPASNSVAAPDAPAAAKPLSGVGVAKVISTGFVAPPTAASFVAPPTMAAYDRGRPLGADFIDAAAFRAPRPGPRLQRVG